jgi:hypothetical protein
MNLLNIISGELGFATHGYVFRLMVVRFKNDPFPVALLLHCRTSVSPFTEFNKYMQW